jgi:hypothetical protein
MKVLVVVALLGLVGWTHDELLACQTACKPYPVKVFRGGILSQTECECLTPAVVRVVNDAGTDAEER